MSHAQSEYEIGAAPSSVETCLFFSQPALNRFFKLLIRPSKTLQTLTDYLTLDQKCVPSHSWMEILVISNVQIRADSTTTIRNENPQDAMLNSLHLLLFWEVQNQDIWKRKQKSNKRTRVNQRQDVDCQVKPDTQKLLRGLSPGARFLKVPVTFRGRNQIFKSKYIYIKKKSAVPGQQTTPFCFINCRQFYHVRCKTTETSILHVNQNSFTGPLIIGTLKKRAPASQINEAK